MSRVLLEDGRVVIFHEPVEGRWNRDNKVVIRYWFPSLDIGGTAKTREEARQAAAKAVWDEADRWLHAQAHTLDGAQRKRRGVFMQLIDVVRSKIAKPLGDFTWVLGRIETQPSGKRCFRAAKTNGECFDFSPALLNGLPADHLLRMAKLRADVVGNPLGPVLEMGEPLGKDPIATLAAWRRLTDKDDE